MISGVYVSFKDCMMLEESGVGMVLLKYPYIIQ